jgi:hypothetical protein
VSNKTTPTPNRPKARLLGTPQLCADSGKSTLADALLCWLDRAGIPNAAFDADGTHRTLSKRYPQDSANYPVGSKPENSGDFAPIFQKAVEAASVVPVLLVDFPGDATYSFLTAVARFSFLDILEKKQIRPTWLLFAGNDDKARDSANEVIRAFGERADYAIVENPARFKSYRFKRTPMYQWLTERGAPSIVIPEVLESTMVAWSTLERKEKAYLSLAKACEHRELDDFQKAELQFMRDRLCAQFEDHAGRLLPDAALIKTRMPRHQTATVYAPMNPFDDPLN